jgi:hypothetical protein
MKTKRSEDERLGFINSQLPSDACIDCNSDGRFQWTFRCVQSEEVEGAELGFDTPLEALLSFTNFLITGADELMDIAFKNLDDKDEE